MSLVKIVIIFVLMLFVSVVVHEYVHYSIYNLFDCEDVYLTFSHDKFLTSGIGVHGVCDKDSDAWLAHSINEIVTYNIMPFFFIVLILLWQIRENTERRFL